MALAILLVMAVQLHLSPPNKVSPQDDLAAPGAAPNATATPPSIQGSPSDQVGAPGTVFDDLAVTDISRCARPGYAFLPKVYPLGLKPMLQLPKGQEDRARAACEAEGACVGFNTRGELYAVQAADDKYWWRTMAACNNSNISLPLDCCCGTYTVLDVGDMYATQAQGVSVSLDKAARGDSSNQCEAVWTQRELPCEAATAEVRSWDSSQCLSSCFPCYVGSSEAQVPAPLCRGPRACRFRCRSLCGITQSKTAIEVFYADKSGQNHVKISFMSSSVVEVSLARTYGIVIKDKMPEGKAMPVPGKVCARPDRSCCSLC